MPKTDIIDDIIKIKKLYPQLRIIVFTWGASERILGKYIDHINGFIDICAEESYFHQIFDKVNNGQNFFVKTYYREDKKGRFFVTDNKS